MLRRLLERLRSARRKVVQGEEQDDPEVEGGEDASQYFGDGQGEEREDADV
jgi:hypothetical protein